MLSLMRMFLALVGILLQIGCQPLDSDPEPSYGDPQSPMGRILIEELYYAGSPAAAGSDHYNADQFIELYNHSDEPVDLSGMLLGDVYGLAGEINPGYSPDSYATSDPERLYFENLWRIPGDPGDVVLYPAETFLIAQDGTNHQPFSSVDSSGADFEAYVSSSGNDEDYAVANLESVHYTAGYDWLITVFGPSVALLEAGSEDELEDTTADGWWELKSVPVSRVIDAIDTLMDGDSGAYKRLPESVDEGFIYVSDTYSGESVRRVREDGIPTDSNDSSVDFEAELPQPLWALGERPDERRSTAREAGPAHSRDRAGRELLPRRRPRRTTRQQGRDARHLALGHLNQQRAEAVSTSPFAREAGLALERRRRADGSRIVEPQSEAPIDKRHANDWLNLYERLWSCAASDALLALLADLASDA